MCVHVCGGGGGRRETVILTLARRPAAEEVTKVDTTTRFRAASSSNTIPRGRGRVAVTSRLLPPSLLSTSPQTSLSSSALGCPFLQHPKHILCSCFRLVPS